MIVDEIAMLLTLTRRVNDKGDDLINQANKLYAEHAREVMQLRAMWEEIGARLEHEERRFERYFPREVREERPQRLPQRPPEERPAQALPQNPQHPQGAPREVPPDGAGGGTRTQTLADAMRSAAARLQGAQPKTVEG